MGSEYQIAAADKATKTTTICSVPYAIDDNASDDNNAKAAKRLICAHHFQQILKAYLLTTFLSNPIFKLLYTQFYFKYDSRKFIVNKML